ncbi:MAG: acryloyl-CoA reductase [Enterococcus sp.]
MNTRATFIVSNTPQFTKQLIQQPLPPLQPGEVTIQVAYSSVNYKDALAASENGGVIRNYPMTPGIDLAGTISQSTTDQLAVGTEVLVTGYGLGVTHPGGFTQLQNVPSDWVVPLPQTLSLKEAMLYGTAGFTAGLAVTALEKSNPDKEQKILITGATGGVGSCAIALLHQLGYQNIIAVTRKQAPWLLELGAKTIVAPNELQPTKKRLLDKQNFDALIDTVGGDLLADLLPQLSYNGKAYLCGNAGGHQLETSVLPFILRGIQVTGIDSVNTPLATRIDLWQRLATDLKITHHLKYQEISLLELSLTLDALLAGQHQGRTIIKL